MFNYLFLFLSNSKISIKIRKYEINYYHMRYVGFKVRFFFLVSFAFSKLLSIFVYGLKFIYFCIYFLFILFAKSVKFCTSGKNTF